MNTPIEQFFEDERAKLDERKRKLEVFSARVDVIKLAAGLSLGVVSVVLGLLAL